MLNKLIVCCLFLLIATFPGIFILKRRSTLPCTDRLIAVPVLSIAFWICITWVLSITHIPFTVGFTVLMGGSVVASVVAFRKDRIPADLYTRVGFHHLALLLAVLLYMFPFIPMTIPPGNDISMHGYISRLIVNSNGLPATYDPILPGSPFGSYSAGYQALTALSAALSEQLLREAINLVSIAVYPLCLLCLVFLYRQFFSAGTAIYVAIITFSINSSLQNTIGWGGNPTILAFGFCLFVAGAALLAIRHSDRFLFLAMAFPLAAVPLVHAIPAITFFYLAIPSFALLLLLFRDKMRWLMIHTVLLGLLTGLLLLPFALGFHNQTSPELTEMIRQWQQNMMRHNFTGSLAKNLLVVLGEIKYRGGDPLEVLFYISVAGLLAFRKFRELLFLGGFLAPIYLLILNSNYWVLPLSELLYPERIQFFMIVCMGIAPGLLIDEMSQKNLSVKIRSLIIPVASVIIVAFACVGISAYWNGFTLSVIRNNKIRCTPPVMDAYTWIEQHTEPDAIIKCTYADAGIWIPTFSNRATIGAHIHFIHEVEKANEALEKSPAPHYLFVTLRDRIENTSILNDTLRSSLVFENGEISVFRKSPGY
jgi:hypothetical protein